MIVHRFVARLALLLVIVSLGSNTRALLSSAALAGMFTMASARADVTLGDVTVSSDTSWPEDTYTADNLSVTDGATLRVAGGSTLTVSGTIAVTDGATILLQGKNAGGQVDGQWQGVGVRIDAGSVSIDGGSAISADAQGYLGGVGPGVGGTDVDGHGGAGGGYGGLGGRAGDGVNAGGAPYGDAFMPVDLGSGGGPTRTAAGSGGGAITLNVSGTLTLNGTITANGGNAVNGNCFSAPAGGGGSGGSIFITTATLAGTGTVRAIGGAGADGGCFPGVGDDGGGGAGGRIAVLYSVDGGFVGITTSRVNGGSGGGHVGAPGTMLFLDTATDALRISQHFDIAPGSAVRFGAVTVENGATLALGGGSALMVDEDLTVRGDSLVSAQGKDTAGQVDGAWRGAGVTIDARNVHVETGSAISADRAGYLAGVGPGVGGSDGTHGGAGGGYGGIGGRAGDSVNAGGPAYGDAFMPVDPGSGGGPTRTAAGNGGGAITLNVSGTLTLDGAISADGGDADPGNCFSAPAGGGGSGGSIFITTATLAGTGTVRAIGGAGADGGCFPGVGDDGGGGAGGRIAVLYGVDGGFGGFAASSVNGGAGGGHVGAPGTMLFLDTATDALRISQHLDFAPDSSARFGAVTLDHGATLTLGGGSTLTVDGDLVISDHSTVVVESKNISGQLDGEWRGAGATIAAHDLRVEAGSAISADAQGYRGGVGPGAGGSDDGTHGGAGGGFGASGGSAGDRFNSSGASYGGAFAPVDLGSGGGVARTTAGSGGGAITLDVTGTLTLDGTITANGGDGASGGCSVSPAGGGSGGSIFVTAATLAGAGVIAAEGGAGGIGGCTGPGDDGGGGGGGRVAVLYSIDGGFGGFTASRVSGGSGGGGAAPPGTMVFLDTAANALRVSRHLDFPRDAVASFGAVTVDNEATLTLGGGVTLSVERDFIVTDASTVLAESENGDGRVNGRWEGSGITINARNLRIDAGSSISADEAGYRSAMGPGAGGADGLHDGGGAGYGGTGGSGGDGVNFGGPVYGEAWAPVDLGSGGGLAGSTPGTGGGAIRLNVGATLRLDGTITAEGADGGVVGCSLAGSGGGAGGSIFVIVDTLAGNGSLKADGGAGGPGGCTGSGDDGGGGGGGRIAVYYNVDDDFAGIATSTVAGDVGGQSGNAGTLFFVSFGCGGDCTGDGRVTIDELVRMVNIALGASAVTTCLAGDRNHSGTITVDEIIIGVNDLLVGCPASG